MAPKISAPPVASHPLPSVDDYLEIGQKAGASDVHLGVAAPPIWRINGSLEPMWQDAPLLTREQTATLAEAFMPDVYKEELNSRGDSDFAYANEFARYRTSVVRQRLGIEIVFRVINTHVRTMDELGLPEHLKLLTRYQNGLILATGSVDGSGIVARSHQPPVNTKKRRHRSGARAGNSHQYARGGQCDSRSENVHVAGHHSDRKKTRHAFDGRRADRSL